MELWDLLQDDASPPQVVNIVGPSGQGTSFHPLLICRGFVCKIIGLLINYFFRLVKACTWALYR